MLKPLNIYKIYCDECGATCMDLIASDTMENAKVPENWIRKTHPEGKVDHICPPCNGHRDDHTHADGVDHGHDHGPGQTH